ncbi:MAG: FkbM family methyltransferase [Candidatus Omnitrophica bacterium]|nr:FkbM family methyltransferase [Candidatus Omnitrophota bacterium]
MSENNLEKFEKRRLEVGSPQYIARLIYAETLRALSLGFKKAITVKAETFWGEKMIVLAPEEVSLKLLRYSFYEEGLTRILLEYLKSGMVFFDIGAHFGYYTLLAGKIVGSGGEVHSFEPTPSTYEILLRNVKDRNNVHANNLAVFSEDKDITFYDYGLRFSAFNSHYAGRLPEGTTKKLKPRKFNIKATSIDEYVSTKGIVPDFIKIDAESAEYEILKGMDRTLKEVKPVISIEAGDEDVDGVMGSRDLIGYIMEKGYEPYEFDGTNIIKHQPEDRYRYKNIVFVPIKNTQ